jgi:copper chaperone CopZ
MKSRAILVLLLMIGMALGCRKQDIRTARIHVPQMSGQACADRVVSVVRRVPGVQTDMITVDRERRDITVPYDSIKLSLKNIEYALAKAGFQANDIPADEKARAALPESCR